MNWYGIKDFPRDGITWWQREDGAMVWVYSDNNTDDVLEKIIVESEQS